MLKNVCGLDRIFRIIAGLGCIVAGIFRLFGGGIAGYIIIVIGIILFFTGAVGHCGIYILFGISTCKKRRDD